MTGEHLNLAVSFCFQSKTQILAQSHPAVFEGCCVFWFLPSAFNLRTYASDQFESNHKREVFQIEMPV